MDNVIDLRSRRHPLIDGVPACDRDDLVADPEPGWRRDPVTGERFYSASFLGDPPYVPTCAVCGGTPTSARGCEHCPKVRFP